VPTNKIMIAIRVRPGASGTRVGGRYHGPFGPALTVAVTAPAVDGRATDAVVRAVAKALGLRPGELTVQLGAASRDKLLAVTDPPTDLPQRLAALRDGPRGAKPASSE
jgi:uncharacterized protein YggU (UPF0235/DUF167 family)